MTIIGEDPFVRPQCRPDAVSYVVDTCRCRVDMTVLIDLQFATMWIQPMPGSQTAPTSLSWAVIIYHAVSPADHQRRPTGG